MPAPPTMELTRHFHTLSEQETNEVVEDVADLIVNFLRGRREPARAGGAGPERNHEPDREQPDTR